VAMLSKCIRTEFRIWIYDGTER